MKIISYNVNGFRACHSKGALDLLIKDHDPDALCIQETKCGIEELLGKINGYTPFAISNNWKSGYAGVSTFIKDSFPNAPHECLHHHLMPEYGEGRIIEVNYDDFTLINVYTLNSGGKDELRQKWNMYFTQYLLELKAKGKKLIVCGDLNVVATDYDYWGDYFSKLDSMPGLMKYEIKHFHQMCSLVELKDAFREIHGTERQYSWYSYRGAARQKNHGWRLDYFLVDAQLMDRVKDCYCLSSFTGSDHSPIVLELND